MGSAVLFPVFCWVYQALSAQGFLTAYEVLNEQMLVGLDGTEYFSSPGHSDHLPTASQPVLDAAESRESGSVAASGGYDEADLRTVIQAALVKYAGWQVSTAAAALEGLQLVQAQQPDLVFLDVSMPDMDGYQCFAQLRAEPSTAKIPVILLTARVLPRDRRQFAQMGIAGVITKPFNPFTLWQQIEKIVS